MSGGDARTDPPAGVGLGLAAYVCWGLFPLFFHLLEGVGAVEVVAHRVVWSLVFCLAVLAVGRRQDPSRPRLRDATSARQRRWLALAAALLALNWGTFVHGVTSGQVVQTSLGYFVTPLVSVLLGVVVLRERLRRLQWGAVALGAAAVLVLTVEDGRPPWIALTLAGSFGLYGLVKNRVGRTVAALPGLTVETAVLLPVAVGYLAAVGLRDGALPLGVDPLDPVLLVVSGPLTAGVLLLFAGAVRRVRLSTVGLLQYVSPVLQLVVGVALLGESLSPARLAGFAVVWGALALLVVDTTGAVRRGRSGVAVTAGRAPAGGGLAPAALRPSPPGS